MAIENSTKDFYQMKSGKNKSNSLLKYIPLKTFFGKIKLLMKNTQSSKNY